MQNILSSNTPSKKLILRELVAGSTTFMSVCYILFVVPNMLADAGMPKESALAATVYVTMFSTLLMGLYARFPVCVAPGLGISAYFAYTICGSMGYPWQTALGCVCISGCVFLLLTISHIRQAIIASVPNDLKHAIVVGIGLFIAFIGLKNCGLVVQDPSTFVRLGNMHDPSVLLAVFGLFLTGTLIAKRVPAAMIIGILGVTLLAVVTGCQSVPDTLITAVPPLPTDTFLQLDVKDAMRHGLFSIIFTLTMVDLFDNMGTLIGLSQKAGFVQEDGTIQNLDKALFSDSVATILSSIFGTTTATSYLESATGIAEGGRTPLTAITVAILFFLSLFCTPLFSCVPSYATAPVLVIVGAMMMQDVGKINFQDFRIALPAFLTIVTMPLTFNISTGFGFGFISYVILNVVTGNYKEVKPIMYIISICFLINFAIR